MKKALIVGAGTGLSAALARLLSKQGYTLVLAARNIGKLADLKTEIEAETFACDATDSDQVAALFAELDKSPGGLDLVLYNASGRVSGAITELDPVAVQQSLMQTAFGAFLVAQQAAQRMLPTGKGAIFFTGATASVKGFAQHAPFAMGKFALRGLSQSLARELGPKNIHVAHFIIDGGIASMQRPDPGDDALLAADAIAQTYLAVLNQSRSAWTQELDLRPWQETF